MLALVGQIQSPFRDVASVFPQIYMTLASTERLIDIDNIKDDKTDKELSKKDIEDFSELVFSDVSFCYDDVNVLNNVNLNVKRGEFIALCGVSGAGKSTLSKLLLSVISPDFGRVYLTSDGKETELCAGTRKLFSYVPQGNMIFSGTLKDNVTFINENATDEQIENALKISCAYEFVQKLPNGLNTLVGENGVGLSEGQVQRLAIARAVLCNAPIILLDEATSALDTVTERLVQDALTNLMKNRTVFAIAHRLSTIRNADLILVMERGEIVERGTHDELYAMNGVYRKLCDMQHTK
jgi:ABC-type multidrug transport system fused ATPase/permease subunit